MFNITNYKEHPTRKTYTVFHFYHQDRADFFKSLLLEESIWFESEDEIQEDRTIYFFGIKNSDLKKVEKLNYLVSAKYRKPIFSNKILRWVLMFFALLVLAFIIMGYLHSKT